jgi:Na+/melibiose symporter-like transporter
MFLILFGVSFIKMAELSILADILDLGPWRAGRKIEWFREGFLNFIFSACSQN